MFSSLLAKILPNLISLIGSFQRTCFCEKFRLLLLKSVKLILSVHLCVKAYGLYAANYKKSVRNSSFWKRSKCCLKRTKRISNEAWKERKFANTVNGWLCDNFPTLCSFSRLYGPFLFFFLLRWRKARPVFVVISRT